MVLNIVSAQEQVVDIITELYHTEVYHICSAVSSQSDSLKQLAG